MSVRVSCNVLQQSQCSVCFKRLRSDSSFCRQMTDPVASLKDGPSEEKVLGLIFIVHVAGYIFVIAVTISPRNPGMNPHALGSMLYNTQRMNDRLRNGNAILSIVCDPLIRLSMFYLYEFRLPTRSPNNHHIPDIQLEHGHKSVATIERDPNPRFVCVSFG
mmetsp:Transcript_34445/g.77666  ORF Transcript_34445/g.77666 Transcript_34445/m.77666 type:complete len:161 (-) Transcript_34445:147-629(-)